MTSRPMGDLGLCEVERIPGEGVVSANAIAPGELPPCLIHFDDKTRGHCTWIPDQAVARGPIRW